MSADAPVMPGEVPVHWADKGAVLHPLHPRRSNVTTNNAALVTCPDCLELQPSEA
ncbi:MAG TPA: hypothetical protein VF642_12205 [Propionibacteriaceae bacterium]|jgi:hypothetical protein